MSRMSLGNTLNVRTPELSRRERMASEARSLCPPAHRPISVSFSRPLRGDGSGSIGSVSSATQPAQSAHQTQQAIHNNMHKIQFAKGVQTQREHWRRQNTIPSLGRAHKGCFARFRIFEENARFMLCAILLLIYVALGALVFSHLERDNELSEKETYAKQLNSSRWSICSDNNLSSSCNLQLTRILDLRGNFSSAGLISPRPKWDFAGAFYFAATVVSTIGFGVTMPRTLIGRVSVLGYGFFGCTACVLFFNLFLERVVTLFAVFLRFVHDRKMLRQRQARLKNAQNSSNNPSEHNGAHQEHNLQTISPAPPQLMLNDQLSEYDDLSSTCGGSDHSWRPSLYKVTACMLTVTCTWITLSAILYSVVESWSYLEAVYFVFVGFATIGFGDFVSSQQTNDTENVAFYRAANFFCLTIGCCCMYSLFNISSVVVRQLLNGMIRHLDVDYVHLLHVTHIRRRPSRYLGLGLRPPRDSEQWTHMTGKETVHRTPSDGMISLREFLCHNQTNMVLLQKQLIESANKNVPPEPPKRRFSPPMLASNVGPLAMLTQTFGQN